MTRGPELPAPPELAGEDFDPVLWELASQVYVGKIRQAREEVSVIEVDCDEIDAVMEEALEQTDRGAAILIFSFVETMMHRTLARQLTGPVKGGVASLFQPNGPLGTASSRLSLLAALEWIDRETYEGIDLLRKIRNHFAHDVTAKSVDNKKLLGWITSLPPLEKRFELIPGLDGVFQRKNGMSTRQLFLARSTLLIWNLLIECALLPSARKHQVDHKNVRTDSGDLPDNLKDACRRFSRIMWLVVHSFAPDHFERAKTLLGGPAAGESVEKEKHE